MRALTTRRPALGCHHCIVRHPEDTFRLIILVSLGVSFRTSCRTVSSALKLSSVSLLQVLLGRVGLHSFRVNNNGAVP
jgi:hypothetical protein